MGCGASTSGPEAAKKAIHPPVEKGGDVLKSLYEALEAEYEKDVEGAVGKWMEENKGNQQCRLRLRVEGRCSPCIHLPGFMRYLAMHHNLR